MSEIVNLVLWLLIVLVFLGLVCLYLYRRDFLKEDDSHQFSSLLNELQRDQGYEPIELVSAWNEEEKVNISNRFRIAWEAGEFAESEIRLSADTNQSSRGIQLWNQFRPLLAEQLDGYEFDTCKLTGYPDQQLVSSNTQKSYAFEEKAHTGWDSNNSNRITIASSTKRLRATFKPPIHHIWAILYHSTRMENDALVCSLRALHLHFVEPKTLMGRRLEILTSNKLLNDSVENNVHTEEIFGALPE